MRKLRPKARLSAHRTLTICLHNTVKQSSLQSVHLGVLSPQVIMEALGAFHIAPWHPQDHSAESRSHTYWRGQETKEEDPANQVRCSVRSKTVSVMEML